MPDISIIIPCYNEEKTIAQVLSAILHQTIDISNCEVVIADGMSTDRTRDAVEEFAEGNSELCIRLVDNKKKFIPSALNTAIDAAKGKYIIRLDAHCVPEETYVERCIHHLQNNTADNVGGVWIIEPGDKTPMAKAIAVAVSNPVGTGNAAYRHAGAAEGLVDTVPFGSFHRSLFDTIGNYDESLLSNEDYDLNVRIRKAGGKVFLDPNIKCIYFARTTLKALSKQYWRYGYWKWRMARKYPDSIRWRQALPPLFILALLSMVLVGIFFPPFWFVFGSIVCVYLLAVIFSILRDRKAKNLSFKEKILAVTAVIAMHFSWGSGFLVSLVQSFIKKNYAN